MSTKTKVKSPLSQFLFNTRRGNILFSILFFILLCIFLEVATRAFLNFYITGARMGQLAKLSYQPYVVWVNGRKTDQYQQLVNREVPAKGEDTYRIIVIGGSTSEQVPSEELIRGFSPYVDKRVEVWNLGHGGYLINQSLIMLALYGIQLEPDLIINIDGVNDISDFTKMMPPGVVYHSKYVTRAVESPWVNALFSVVNNSQFVLAVIKLGERAQERAAQHDVERFEKMADNFVTTVGTISALAEGKGIKHLAVLQPYLFLRSSITPREQSLVKWYEYRREFYKKSFLSMKEELSRQNFTQSTMLITALDAFDQSNEEVFIDEVHLTPEGNRLFVDYIVKKAVMAGVLPAEKMKKR